MLTAGGWGVDKFQKKNLQKSSSILHVCWNPNIIFKSTFTPPQKNTKNDRSIVAGFLWRDVISTISSIYSTFFGCWT